MDAVYQSFKKCKEEVYEISVNSASGTKLDHYKGAEIRHDLPMFVNDCSW